MKRLSFLLLFCISFATYAQQFFNAPVVKGKKVASVLKYDVRYTPEYVENGKDLKEGFYFNKSGSVDSQKKYFYLSNRPCNYFVYNSYKKGYILQKKEVNCGAEKLTTYNYNKHNQMVEYFDNQDKIIYSYNNKGKIILAQYQTLDGKQVYKDTIIRNDKGYATLNITLTGINDAKYYYYYYTHTAFDSLEYEYDISKLKESPYTVDTLCITHNTYDAQHRLVEHTFKGTQRQFSYVYTYQPDGSHTKTYTEFGGSTLYIYNPQGYILEEKNWHGYVVNYTYNTAGLLIRVDTHNKDNKISHSEVYEYTYW